MRPVFSATHAPAHRGNRVDVLLDAADTYAALEAAIEGARHHVHLSYYIFRADETGLRFLKLLARKASEGVEVRLLVDGWGSSELGDPQVAPLVQAGGRFAVFAPVRWLVRAPTLNLRNHRKIVVVDGRIGFTGGLNIGDEYRGKLARRGPWRDTHLRVEGPATARLQEIFAEDWFYAADEDLARHAYFPRPEPAGPSAVQIIESGPDESAEQIHRALFVAVTQAKERVWMTNPYFVPDRALLVAFETAARRGVDVRLLLPGRSDSPLTFHAGRGFYPFLLEAGCKVYEYTHGMLHSKTMVVDGCWSTVGSANMDRRSFALNFEANAIIHDVAVNRRLAEVFERDLLDARPATLPRSTDWGRRALEALCFVLAPLL
ncbi:MAG: cardiolipin synthase [Myxococcales bacterium]|nr:cardiolipin synthase [Myxococcales bacterium]